MTQRTCTEDGCDKPHRARGFCSSHYNATKYYNRDGELKDRTCSGCGVNLERRSRYDGKPVHCSEMCRQWAHFGAWSSKLPSSHPAYVAPVRKARKVKPKPPPKIKRTFECEWCGLEGSTHQTIARFCSDWCARKNGKMRRRARERGATGTYSWAQVTRLWMAFNKSCAYCRRPTPLDQIQAEHVTALSRGGTNSFNNILPSCGPCNQDKQALSLTAWAATRAKRNLPPVVTTWDALDPLYLHLVYYETEHAGVAA